MKRWIAFVRVFGFLAIGGAILAGITHVLAEPKGEIWAVGTGMDLVYKYKNQYDVLTIGTSTVIENINNQELYEQYGIASVCIGEPEQPMYFSRYTLEDALRVQKPQVVLIDTKALFYTDEWNSKRATEVTDYLGHTSIDQIKSYDLKAKALDRFEEFSGPVDRWDYFSTLYYSHGNWKNLTKNHFCSPDLTICMNGNVADYNMAAGGNDADDYTQGPEEDSVKDLIAMIELCREKGAEPVLVTSYTTGSKSFHEDAQAIADKMQVSYVDMNDHINEIGLQLNTDLCDSVHLNLAGSIKWTDYLGEWLKQNYSFEDRRMNSRYRRYENQREAYAAMKDHMDTALRFIRCLDLYSYLREIVDLNLSEYTVCISVFHPEGLKISEESRDLLKEIGLQINDDHALENNYAAILTENGVLESCEKELAARLTGNVDKNTYTIVSGKEGDADASSININGYEFMQKGPGLNIVIFNNKLGYVLSTVYYDISLSPDPFTRKRNMVNVTEARTLIEMDTNIWTEQG